MKNFQKILDRIVQKRFKGDKDKITKYYDFISLYLSRYENAYVSLCDDHGICLKNRDDDFTHFARVYFLQI